MAIQKGTGFTNLNRVLQANKGNKLGQSISGGIQGQVQGVNTQVKSAQQQFQDEAQKGRLDTEEAANKRTQVLGQFGQQAKAPDESQFQASSGLQERFTQQKTALQQQQEAAKAASEQQRSQIQAKQTANQAAQAQYEANQKRYQDLQKSKAVGGAYQNSAQEQEAKRLDAILTRDYGQYKGTLASNKSLSGLLNTQEQARAAQEADLQNQLSGLDTQYGEQTTAEKQAWLKSEMAKQDEALAANLPGQKEIDEFARFRAGAYTGPKELQDSASLFGKAQQTEALGGLTRSEGGRQELLRRFVGGTGYTPGQRQLDSTILGQQPGQLGQAARQARGAVGQVEQANLQAANLAQEYTGRAKAFGDETQKQIQAMRDPLSQRVDQQVGELTGKEQQRQTDFKQIQDLLSGNSPQAEGMDKVTRTGIALQSALDSGYLSKEDGQQLVGQGGLLQRAMDLGLDPGELLSQRMQSISAQGIGRSGAASASQEARLSALDKLMGKTSTDVEFGRPGQEFQAGRTDYGLGALEDYISKTEAERAKTDPGFAQQLQAQKPYGLKRMAGGIGQMLGAGTSGTGLTSLAGGAGIATASQLGAALAGGGATIGAGPAGAAVMLGMDALNKGDTSAQITEGGIQTASGAGGAALEGKDAILQGLLKLNVGGNSLGNSPIGKQLNELLNAQSKAGKNVLEGYTNEGMTWAQGLRDLTQNQRLDQAWSKLSGLDIAKSVGSNASKVADKALFGGKTGNWGTGEFNTIDAATGKKVKIGSFANKSSQDILKQMLDSKQIGRTASRGNSGSEGAKAMDLLNKYYQAAVQREQTQKESNPFRNIKVSDEDQKENIEYNPSDVHKFMDRIKPAAYDYKDEVKDSPLASKNRELGVMAQDLEKSEMGNEAVHDTPEGKVVDYDNLEPKMLASIASLHNRLKQLEKKK